MTGESNLCHERAIFAVKEQFVPQVGFFLEEDLCLGNLCREGVPQENNLWPGRMTCPQGKQLVHGERAYAQGM